MESVADVPLTEVKMGEVISVKIRGSSKWPARVVELENNSIGVEFYGDQTT